MANFVGKWKLDKVDNLDGFMKVAAFFPMELYFVQSMGAPPELIKKALENQDKHNIEISNSGNKWNIKSDTMKMNHEFELGKQVEETGPCGRSTKNITRMDGNKLITDARYEDVSFS